MKNINICIMIFWVLLFLILGCKQSEFKNTSPVSIKEKSSINIPLDSIALYNLLYSNKRIIPSLTSLKPFSLSVNRKNDMIIFSAETTVNSLKIEYEVFIKSNMNIKDFNWQENDIRNYSGATIKVDKTLIDVFKVKIFDTDKNIYPAGLWHWSVEDIGSVKMVEYNNKVYILLNGANLFCNGSQCNSYQLYAMVYNKATQQLNFNAIETDGIYPYLFSSIEFCESTVDKLPEFYILKNGVTDIFGLEDFNIFGFNEEGSIYKK